MAKTEGTG